MAKPKIDPVRKQLKARAKEIAQQAPVDDIFGGLGDWDPAPARKMAIARAIAMFEGIKIAKPKPKAAKPQVVKRAPKPKAAPKPKKGKKVGKVNEVCIKSPDTRETQWLPLVAEISELLAEGWEIVDGDMPVDDAYKFLNFNPEEMQSA